MRYRYRFGSKEDVVKTHNRKRKKLKAYEKFGEKIMTIRQIKNLYREFLKRITLSSQTKMDALMDKIGNNYSRLLNLKDEVREYYRGRKLVTSKKDETEKHLNSTLEKVNKLFSKEDFEETLPLIESVIRTRKRLE